MTVFWDGELLSFEVTELNAARQVLKGEANVPEFVSLPLGDTNTMVVGVTVKGMPLEARPLAVTTIFPVVAALPSCATICVSLQEQRLQLVTRRPPKATVLEPCEAPKLLPKMRT